MNSNINKYKEIFTDVFSVNESELNETFSRESIKDWDSIHQLNLLTYIEDTFDVMLSTDDALSLISYAKGIEILSTKYDIIF
jgi:acyl carrier protein